MLNLGFRPDNLGTTATTTTKMEPSFRLSVAPMVAVTTRPFRYLCRLLSPTHAVLYTEMATDDVLLHARPDLVRDVLLPEASGPVVLQIASHDPDKAAEVAAMGESAGFKEINLNCGCPSSKAVSSCNGAALMRDPDLVMQLVSACRRRVQIPVTVKCRLGVDDMDSLPHVMAFIDKASRGGASFFSIHARKGILGGLGTKANRSVPPLKYDWVYQIARDFPDLKFELNGGISTLNDVSQIRAAGDLAGCMIGRAIYHSPCFLSHADALLFPETAVTQTRGQVIEKYVEHYEPLIDDRLTCLKSVVEPIMKMFAGTGSSNAFRTGLHKGLHDKSKSTLSDIAYSALDACERDIVNAEI